MAESRNCDGETGVIYLLTTEPICVLMAVHKYAIVIKNSFSAV
jgi:hypothetical protein